MTTTLLAFPGGEPNTTGQFGSLLNNTDFQILHIVVTNQTANPVLSRPSVLTTNAPSNDSSIVLVRAVICTSQHSDAGLPAIWLYSQQSVAVVHRRVADVRIRPDAPYALVRTWRIPPDRLIDRDRVERR